MKSFTDQEYLQLIQEIVDKQYDDAIDDYDIEKMEWIPAEPEIKKKLESLNHHGMIDLTNVKSSKLKEEIKKCANLRVGAFKVMLTHVHPNPIKGDVGYDLNIKEERTKTPSGMPCRVDYRMDILKDSRFKGRPWLKYFKGEGYACNVPIDTVVEMVRWMQAIKKLTAFL
jgi:hypothetical protein